MTRDLEQSALSTYSAPCDHECATPRSALPALSEWKRWDLGPLLWGKHRWYREEIANPENVAVLVEGWPDRWRAICCDPFEDDEGRTVYDGDSFDAAKSAADAAWFAQAPQPAETCRSDWRPLRDTGDGAVSDSAPVDEAAVLAALRRGGDAREVTRG